MKIHLYSSFFLLCLLKFGILQSQTNIGFESGNASGWTVSGSYSVLSSGNDPNFSSIECVYPGGGNYSIRIGDYKGSSGDGATLKQSFTVSSSNASFIYHYAVVLEDGNHNASDQPYFQIRMYDQNNKEITCATYDVNANTASTVGFSSSGSFSYKDWTSILVPLDDYIGQKVTIEFIVDWCVYDVHLGYAYIDCEVAPLDLLSSSPITCGGQAITLTAPTGAQQYSWTGPNSFSSNNDVVSVTDPGTYYCTILSKNTSGAYCTSKLDITISGNPSNPVADFSASNTCLGTSSQFTDLSSISGSTIASWQWDFGDGGTSSQQNPTHTYSSSGNFTVTLTVTTAEGCTATLSQTLTISKAPTLTFSSTDENCGLKDGTASVNATGGSGSYTYQWATSPKQTTATASGLSAGSYTVSVDDGFCSTTGKATVNALSGPSLILTSTNENCGASDGTASVSVSGGSGNYSYSWNTTPVQTTSNVSGLSSGTYTVTVDDGICTVNGNVTVNASASPTLSFNTTNENCGASDGTATVTASGGTGTYSYQWNTSPIQTTMQATGLPSATYTVSVDDGNCTTSGNVTVSSNNSPSLALTSTNTTCSNANGTASVTASGGTGIYSYSWNTSPVQTTATTSNLNPGNYTVTVDDGICSVNSTVSVIADPDAIVPQADFDISNVCLNENSLFTDLSNSFSTTITNWQWDFGDGNTSNQQSPNHQFSQEGNYSVTLNITNQYGCINTIIKTATVYPLPQNNFSVADVCFNQFSVFTDASGISSGAITNWQWDFGDGGLSNQTSPSYAYSIEGSYAITLITTSDNGCKDTLVKNTNVFPLPVADFSTIDVCAKSSTPFTDLSSINSGTIASWNWSFGDGNTSTQQSPNHQFAQAGNYTVGLTTTSDMGCSSSISHNTSVNTNPTADFSFADVCLYDSAGFLNTSSIASGNISSYEWDFGDGNLSTLPSPTHQFNQSGNYTVNLIAVSGSSCKDTMTKNISIFPVPQAAINTSDVCDKQSAGFNDISNANGALITSWEWDFGSAGYSTEQNPNLVFPSSGNYSSQLIITSSDGCKDTASGNIQIYPLPIVDYTTKNVCLNEQSIFTNLSYLSSGSVSAWNWNFDDGNTSNVLSPTYTFSQDGTYDVTLIATTDFGCKDSITQVLTIYPLPIVNFNPDKYEGCIDLDIEFTNLSTISSTSIQSYYWDFGDGSTSVIPDPKHVYETPGTYFVTLLATSDKGCIAESDFPVSIEAYSLPIANFSFAPDYISILNPTVEFTDLSTDAVNWEWYLGDETVDYLQNLMHTYTDTGNYQIILTVTNQYGCIDSLIDYIRINPDAIVYIPNAFTPNGNGVNDSFTAQGIGIIQFEMYIFDRWGDKIYYTNDISMPWNGEVQGTNTSAQEDVYVYSIRVRNVLGEDETYVGKVSLIR